MGIHVDKITNAVAEMCMEANYNLGDDIVQSYHDALADEESDVAKNILEQLIENAEIAKEEKMPICQDTGMTVVFVELGQDAKIEGGDLSEAINKGVAKGYTDGYLRKSVVKDPLDRVNTGDNTPAVIHTEIVPGSEMKITVAPKGFGSENMSKIKMLKPADGVEGIKEFVLETVEEAGPNPCPPIIVGIGIGGTFEKSALIAKKSLLRNVGDRNPDPKVAELEKELLKEINELDVGPQGLGGITTALDVYIETYPTHIAGLPVAVNISCHVTRHKERTLA